MLKKAPFALFSGLLFFSCSSLRPAQFYDGQSGLTANNLEELSGKYRIFSTDTSNRTLSYSLLLNDRFNFVNSPKNNDYVLLEVLDSNHLQTSIIENDSLIQTEVLKGSISNGFFELNSKTNLSLFTLLLNGYSTQKTRIGSLSDGNIILDTNGHGCALFVILPLMCSQTEQYGLIFEKMSVDSRQ